MIYLVCFFMSTETPFTAVQPSRIAMLSLALIHNENGSMFIVATREVVTIKTLYPDPMPGMDTTSEPANGQKRKAPMEHLPY